MAKMQKDSLKKLLFGSPFCDRTNGIDPLVGQLNGLIDQLLVLLEEEHGETRALKQSKRELHDVKQMPSDTEAGVFAKRGVLLFAIWRDPLFAERWQCSDAALLHDLQTRILPIVGPIFLANLGQTPEQFLQLTSIFLELWSGIEFRLEECEEEAGE
jgi:hypothetical protein